MAEPLSAAEEAHLRQCSSLGGEDLRRVWATLDAARMVIDIQTKQNTHLAVSLADARERAIIAETELAREREAHKQARLNTYEVVESVNDSPRGSSR